MEERNPKNPIDTIQESGDPQAAEQINFQALLFLQINRCNILLSNMSPNFPASVEALESTAHPYLDEKYLEAKRLLNKVMKENLKTKINSTGNIDRFILQNAAMYRAQRKMKMILQSAERAGLLPSKTIEVDVG